MWQPSIIVPKASSVISPRHNYSDIMTAETMLPGPEAAPDSSSAAAALDETEPPSSLPAADRTFALAAASHHERTSPNRQTSAAVAAAAEQMAGGGSAPPHSESSANRKPFSIGRMRGPLLATPPSRPPATSEHDDTAASASPLLLAAAVSGGGGDQSKTGPASLASQTRAAADELAAATAREMLSMVVTKRASQVGRYTRPVELGKRRPRLPASSPPPPPTSPPLAPPPPMKTMNVALSVTQLDEQNRRIKAVANQVSFGNSDCRPRHDDKGGDDGGNEGGDKGGDHPEKAVQNVNPVVPFEFDFDDLLASSSGKKLADDTAIQPTPNSSDDVREQNVYYAFLQDPASKKIVGPFRFAALPPHSDPNKPRKTKPAPRSHQSAPQKTAVQPHFKLLASPADHKSAPEKDAQLLKALFTSRSTKSNVNLIFTGFSPDEQMTTDNHEEETLPTTAKTQKSAAKSSNRASNQTLHQLDNNIMSSTLVKNIISNLQLEVDVLKREKRLIKNELDELVLERRGDETSSVAAVGPPLNGVASAPEKHPATNSPGKLKVDASVQTPPVKIRKEYVIKSDSSKHSQNQRNQKPIKSSSLTSATTDSNEDRLKPRNLAKNHGQRSDETPDVSANNDSAGSGSEQRDPERYAHAQKKHHVNTTLYEMLQEFMLENEDLRMQNSTLKKFQRKYNADHELLQIENERLVQHLKQMRRAEDDHGKSRQHSHARDNSQPDTSKFKLAPPTVGKERFGGRRAQRISSDSSDSFDTSAAATAAAAAATAHPMQVPHSLANPQPSLSGSQSSGGGMDRNAEHSRREPPNYLEMHEKSRMNSKHYQNQLPKLNNNPTARTQLQQKSRANRAAPPLPVSTVAGKSQIDQARPTEKALQNQLTKPTKKLHTASPARNAGNNSNYFYVAKNLEMDLERINNEIQQTKQQNRR